LVGQFACHECGAYYLVSFEMAAFEAWLRIETAAREKSQAQQMQRIRSDLGRAVAIFRRDLERVGDIGDIEGW
jgi:hypothetical protein